MRHTYTSKEIEWLRTNAPGKQWIDITELFNKRFNLNFNMTQLRKVGNSYGIKNGLDCRFQKGQIPYSKGKKGVNFGGENAKKTQFKKGQKPQNHREVGSERISYDGYIEVKVAEPSVWKRKHTAVWESVNGPVPEGKVIIFGDRNKQNFDIDNLIMVSRSQLMMMGVKDLIQDNAELTKTGVIIADLYLKITEMKKSNNSPLYSIAEIDKNTQGNRGY